MAYDKITADMITENRELRALLDKVDREYDLSGSWSGNGCEHGFKPAAACPNKDCAVAGIQREWERLMAPNAPAQGPGGSSPGPAGATGWPAADEAEKK